jgi:hypothetical protein
MKKYLLLICLNFILSGCAKKSYTLDSIKTSKQKKASKDSINQKKSEITDKTITIINKQMDTSFKISGNSLIGYIDLGSSKNADATIDSHFENNDLSLDLHANKKTGKINAIATQKLKSINLKFQEETQIYKDVQKTEQQESKVKFITEAKTDSSSNHKIKQSDPIVSVTSLKKMVISFVIIIAVIGIAIYLCRRFTIISKIIGWVKN